MGLHWLLIWGPNLLQGPMTRGLQGLFRRRKRCTSAGLCRVCQFSDCSDRFFHEALEVYRSHSLLPHFSAEGAAGELSCWRALWADIPQRDRPSTLMKSSTARAFHWYLDFCASSPASR